MKRTISAVLSAILMIALASCSKETENQSSTKDFTFENCITTIKMQLPDKWTTYTRYYDNPSYNIKNILSMRINNELVYNLNGDNGIEFEINKPYLVFDDGIDSLKTSNEIIYNEIINKKEYTFSGNHVFLDELSKKGFVFIDNKMLFHLNIEHWPKDGITKELESFFASLHLK